jgi:DNA repair protein RecO (recombination protein O)
MAGRSYKTEAIVLRSMRFGEADRILHLYTRERGRIGAIAKGIRKTKSRVGARLEPLSHVALQLHEGSGELQTVTGVDLVHTHRASREDPYRLGAGLIGAEAMLRLFGEPEANPRAFEALSRFLDALDETEMPDGGKPALDALALSFQLKLLWLSGYLPHVRACVECGAVDELVGFSPRAGGAVCQEHARGSFTLSPEGLAGIERLLTTPLADAAAAGLGDRARREALKVVTSSYEEHGGFQLRTLSA